MPEAWSPEGRKQVANPTPAAGSKAAFAAKVLAGLGAPASPGNIQFLLAWFAREGTRASYNPMATTLKYGSYGKDLNSVGVKNYNDEASGVGATVKTLQSSRYSGIVADLKANNPQGAASNHPAEFKAWSGGGYDRIIIGNVGDTIGGQPVSAAGGSGVSGGAPAAGSLPANATPQQVEQFIKDNYPSEAAFLDIPEVRDILNQAAQADAAGDPWSQTKLDARVQNTNWYKTTGGNARAFLLLQKTDPASAEQQIQQKMAELASQLYTTGLDVGDLHAYAENAIKTGMTADQITQDIKRKLDTQSNATGLKQGSQPDVIADHLMQEARSDYFVPLSRMDVEKWAIDINAGLRTEDQFKNYLQDQANARFPGLKALGITPGEYLAPIRNTIADTLELQPGDVDLLNPKFAAVLQQPDANGLTRPMTISEAQKWARSMPDYQYTKGANDQASQFAETLGRTFGRVA